MKTLLYMKTFALALALAVPAAIAQDNDTQWPREIEAPRGKIVIYEPQLESFDNVTLKARSAVSVTPEGKTEPVFGAAWFTARVAVDRESNVVTLLDVAVTNARFPNAEEAHIEEFKRIVEAEIPKWNLELSYDQLAHRRGGDPKMESRALIRPARGWHGSDREAEGRK